MPTAAASAPELETDESLFADFRDRKDERALARLVERQWPASYRLALAIVRDPGAAEDVAQEGLVRLVSWARRRGSIESLGPWLRSAVANAARNHLRSGRRRVRHEERSARPERVAEAAGNGLDEELAGLPEDQRIALSLHFGLGYTHTEVGEAVGCAAGTASSRIRLGLERVRARLEAKRPPAFASVEAALTAMLSLPAGGTPRAPSVELLLVRAAARSPLASLELVAKSFAALLGVALLVVLARGAFAPPVGVPVAQVPGSEPAFVSTFDPPGTTPGQAGVEAPLDGRGSVPGLARESVAPVESASVPAPAPTHPHLKAAEPRYHYHGRVVDSSGRPVPGAIVRLAQRPFGPGDVSESEDSPEDPLTKGRELEETQAAALDLDARAQVSANRAAARARLAASGDPDESAVDLLGRLGQLEEMGAPKLTIDLGLEATTDPDGTFAIESRRHAPDPLTKLVVEASQSREGETDELGGERVLTHAQLERLFAEGRYELGDVRIAPVLKVTVVVVSRGAPVPGAVVTLVDRAAGPFGLLGADSTRGYASTERLDGTRVDASGRVRLRAPGPQLLLAVVAPGFAIEQRSLELAEVSAPVEVDLVPEALVLGTVLDGHGRPLAGAEANAWPEENTSGLTPYVSSLATAAVSGADGRFSIPGLRAGTRYTVSFSTDDPTLAGKALTVTAPAADLTVTLERAATLVVGVALRTADVAEVTSSVADAVSVERRDGEHGEWESIGGGGEVTQPSVAGSTVELRFRTLAPGHYRVRFAGVAEPALGPATSDELDLAADDRGRVQLLVGPGRVVRGRVVSSSGAPVLGAMVTTGGLEPVVTAGGGRYVIVVGREDSLELRAFELEQPLVRAKATVGAGQSEAPDLVLPDARR